MEAEWVNLSNNTEFWNLEWFNESRVPKSLLSFSRNVPWIQERLLKEVNNSISLARENNVPVIVFSIHEIGAFSKVVSGDGKFTIIQ